MTSSNTFIQLILVPRKIYSVNCKCRFPIQLRTWFKISAHISSMYLIHKSVDFDGKHADVIIENNVGIWWDLEEIWIFAAITIAENLWVLYFLIYSGLTLSIIWIVNPLQISFINQTFLINNNNKIIKFLLPDYV